jgi:glyoxylase-like metal-dependent hydrolase (beta-lactamase superfamily II)
MRTLTSLAGNTQRLDGGAMFGNAPKALWSRWIAPDERNRIPLACRCLLVRDQDRLILFEAGIGAFFPPALKDRFGVVEDEHVLLGSLAAVGVAPEQIDVCVLSHLHFDHAGGLLTAWRVDAGYELVFPNARFVVGAEAWARARAPHARDRASFVPELVELVAGRELELVDGERSQVLGEGYRLYRSDGHTPGLLATEIDMPDGPVVFCADLIPGVAWVHLSITMGYDRFPELLIDEKQRLLADLIGRGGRLFFTHDPKVALARLARDDRGRFLATDVRESFADLDR